MGQSFECSAWLIRKFDTVRIDGTWCTVTDVRRDRIRNVRILTTNIGTLRVSDYKTVRILPAV